MATGRIGVTPTLRTRWSKQPSAGTTSLSGLDDNSVALVYDVGYEAVYRNGTLLSRGNDYTATNGTTVTLIDATLAGDIIEILANQLVPLTNAISNGQFTAKGALLSATAASTPGVLTVGANDTVLTADSSTATGLKWATPSSATLTIAQIATGTLNSGTSLTLSSLTSYNYLVLQLDNIRWGTADDYLQLRINNGSTSVYSYNVGGGDEAATYQVNTTTGDGFLLSPTSVDNDNGSYIQIKIMNCKNAGFTDTAWTGNARRNNGANWPFWAGGGIYKDAAAVSSLVIRTNSGYTFSGTGTYTLWGG